MMLHPTICRRLSFTAAAFHASGLWVVCLISAGSLPMARGADWPQILGPYRDGQAESGPVRTDWAGQMNPKWRITIGSGYAGPAVVGEKILMMDRQGQLERVQAVRRTDGQLIWESTWPVEYRGGIHEDFGPRCVPTVSQDQVVCYGVAGDLYCFDLQTGKKAWGRRLRAEYEAEDGYFGAACSPLVMDGVVVVCLGGKQAGIVGLDLATGRTLWKATDYDASYASPVAVRRENGSDQVLVVTRLNVVLIDVEDGAVRGDLRFGSRGPTVNAATPIPYDEGKFLLTASYGVGTLLLDTAGGGLKQLFRDRDLLGSQYNTPVRVGRNVVGINGREDAGLASWRAIDPNTREVVWEQAGRGTAHLIARGSQVLALGLRGKLTLLETESGEFKMLAETQLPPGTYRALPALVDHQLIVRVSQGADSSEMMCFPLP